MCHFQWFHKNSTLTLPKFCLLLHRTRSIGSSIVCFSEAASGYSPAGGDMISIKPDSTSSLNVDVMSLDIFLTNSMSVYRVQQVLIFRFEMKIQWTNLCNQHNKTRLLLFVWAEITDEIVQSGDEIGFNNPLHSWYTKHKANLFASFGRNPKRWIERSHFVHVEIWHQCQQGWHMQQFRVRQWPSRQIHLIANWFCNKTNNLA